MERPKCAKVLTHFVVVWLSNLPIWNGQRHQANRPKMSHFTGGAVLCLWWVVLVVRYCSLLRNIDLVQWVFQFSLFSFFPPINNDNPACCLFIKFYAPFRWVCMSEGMRACVCTWIGGFEQAIKFNFIYKISRCVLELFNCPWTLLWL